MVGNSETHNAVPEKEESLEENRVVTKRGPVLPAGVSVNAPQAIRREVQGAPKLADAMKPQEEGAGLVDGARREQIRQGVLGQSQRKPGERKGQRQSTDRSTRRPGPPLRDQ